jgi:hypothetical protein
VHLYAQGWSYAGIGIVDDIAVVVFSGPCATAGCSPGTDTGTRLGGPGPALRQPASMPPPSRSAPPTPAASGRGCAPKGRVRVVPRTKGRVRVEVNMSCKQPGRRYSVRVRDGRRRKVVPLRRSRAVVNVRASRRARWVRVQVDEDARPLGSVRVRVGAS